MSLQRTPTTCTLSPNTSNTQQCKTANTDADTANANCNQKYVSIVFLKNLQKSSLL